MRKKFSKDLLSHQCLHVNNNKLYSCKLAGCISVNHTGKTQSTSLVLHFVEIPYFMQLF